MKRHGQRTAGFTIVELLIVIVVIAILAAITIVAYNGIQQRSQTAKIDTDLSQLKKAAMTARVVSGEKVLQATTGSWSTAGTCVALPDGTDLSVRNATTDTCWTSYINALNTISTTSGVNVRGLLDPWGRPYYIDENETEGGAICGGRDGLGVFARPHVQNGWTGYITNLKMIPYITPGC